MDGGDLEGFTSDGGKIREGLRDQIAGTFMVGMHLAIMVKQDEKFQLMENEIWKIKKYRQRT